MIQNYILTALFLTTAGYMAYALKMRMNGGGDNLNSELLRSYHLDNDFVLLQQKKINVWVHWMGNAAAGIPLLRVTLQSIRQACELNADHYNLCLLL